MYCGSCCRVWLFTNQIAVLQSINVLINSHLFVGDFIVRAREVHSIPNLNGAVTGIALLNDRLYFCHPGNPNIAVCCPATFQFQQYINCYCSSCGYQSGILQCPCYQQRDYLGWIKPHVTELQHLAACDFNNCLYVSAHDTIYQRYHICKVAVGQNNTLSSWHVALLNAMPLGLSITSSHNLLAALTNNYLMEYSPDGQLIRQISLQPAGITAPVHAVQLSNDQFGVTHHGPKHQFSILSSDGQQLVQSYRGDAGDMNGPSGIAVDERGRIFVADQRNNRILVMDSKTLSAYPLPLPTDCDLDSPYSIQFDAVSRRLYIGELSACRIVCCQL